MNYSYVGSGTISVSSKAKVEFCPAEFPIQVFEVVERILVPISHESTWYEIKSRFKVKKVLFSSLLPTSSSSNLKYRSEAH